MATRQEVLLTGAGGQGLVLASIILAEAAVSDNKNVVQTQSYGPEARGGASMAGVIIDTELIEYPKVTHPSVLLVMNEASFKKYLPRMVPGGIVVVDSTFCHGPYPDGYELYASAITRLAVEELKRKVVANVIALTVVNAVARLVSPEALKDSILRRVPEGSGAINLQAFELGYRIYRQELTPDRAGCCRNPFTNTLPAKPRLS